jgi:hypothetical protein
VDDEPEDGAWKLKLRYGQIKTPYFHYSVIAEGVAGVLSDGFSCPPGGAFMGMKAWASSSGEATDMIRVIGQQIGFTVTGHTYVYDTEPAQPPGENPRGYDINFTPFASDKE